MGFLPFRREQATGASARDRLGLLRRALDRAGVDYSPANPQASLAQLPPSAAPVVGIHRAPPQPFESPLLRPAKIAFFTNLFHPGAHGKLFPELAGHAHDVLVLPLNTALELTSGFAGTASAVVVITSVADAPLSDQQRDRLWRTLGLPIFEQLTFWDGTVIARECEIHDGLHVAPEAALAEVESEELLLTQLTAGESVLRARTGLKALLTSTFCECGRETPRLKNLFPLPAKTMSAHAA